MTNLRFPGHRCHRCHRRRHHTYIAHCAKPPGSSGASPGDPTTAPRIRDVNPEPQRQTLWEEKKNKEVFFDHIGENYSKERAKKKSWGAHSGQDPGVPPGHPLPRSGGLPVGRVPWYMLNLSQSAGTGANVGQECLSSQCLEDRHSSI